MENYDVYDCNVNDSYVVIYRDKKIVNGVEKISEEYRTITGENLLLTFEGDLNAIAYTNAVDKHIERSIKISSYNKGYNDFYKDFENGHYDSEKELEKVYSRAVDVFHNIDIVFVLIDGRIYSLTGEDDTVNKLCAIYNNSIDNIDVSKYKYLNGFVNHMSNNKKLIK